MTNIIKYDIFKYSENIFRINKPPDDPTGQINGMYMKKFRRNPKAVQLYFSKIIGNKNDTYLSIDISIPKWCSIPLVSWPAPNDLSYEVTPLKLDGSPSIEKSLSELQNVLKEYVINLLKEDQDIEFNYDSEYRTKASVHKKSGFTYLSGFRTRPLFQEDIFNIDRAFLSLHNRESLSV